MVSPLRAFFRMGRLGGEENVDPGELTHTKARDDPSENNQQSSKSAKGGLFGAPPSPRQPLAPSVQNEPYEAPAVPPKLRGEEGGQKKAPQVGKSSSTESLIPRPPGLNYGSGSESDADGGRKLPPNGLAGALPFPLRVRQEDQHPGGLRPGLTPVVAPATDSSSVSSSAPSSPEHPLGRGATAGGQTAAPGSRKEPGSSSSRRNYPAASRAGAGEGDIGGGGGGGGGGGKRARTAAQAVIPRAGRTPGKGSVQKVHRLNRPHPVEGGMGAGTAAGVGGAVVVTPSRHLRTPEFSGRPARFGSQLGPSSLSKSLNAREVAPPGGSSCAAVLVPRFPLAPSPPGFYGGEHFGLDQWSDADVENNVQVMIRVRPLSSKEVANAGHKRCVKQDSPHSLTFSASASATEEYPFAFDHVAGEHVSQDELFRAAGWPMVENCLAGYNSTMFAYGQTGSGKTHTMLGDIEGLQERHAPPGRGIIPRVFEHIFDRIHEEVSARRGEQLQFRCTCSFLEIYNELITDLLDPSRTGLHIREDARRGMYVEDLTEVAIESLPDVVALLLQGAANRKVATTNMNRESSRSHTVFTCTIESTWVTNAVTNTRFGRLNLVDLAGSERQKSSGATGERLKEASSINKSLTHLGHVIMILVEVAKEKKERHVPYRDSKLTFLLQDSLGGNSKTTMIANISPSFVSQSETLSTLRFAQRAKLMRNNAVVNEDASGDVLALKEQIRKLKEEVWRMRGQGHKLSASPSLRASLHLMSASAAAMLTPPLVRRMSTDGTLSLQGPGGGGPAGSPLPLAKKMVALEAILKGALRREHSQEVSNRRLTAEIDQLNRLVHLREEDVQCAKMVLRFREDKIRRLEALEAQGDGGDGGQLSAADVVRAELAELRQEVAALQGKLERNPEVTKFAMENIRLLEQVRGFHDFYDAGERASMAAEIRQLRDQVLELLEQKHRWEHSSSARHHAQRAIESCDGVSSEVQVLRLEADSYQKDLAECRNNLASCLEANAKMAMQVEEQQQSITRLRAERASLESKLLLLQAEGAEGQANGTDAGGARAGADVAELVAHIQQRQAAAEEEAAKHEALHSQLRLALEDAAQLRSRLAALQEEEVRRAAELEEQQSQKAEESLASAQEAALAAEAAMEGMRLALEDASRRHAAQLARLEAEATASAASWHAAKEEMSRELQEAYGLIEELRSPPPSSSSSPGHAATVAGPPSTPVASTSPHSSGVADDDALTPSPSGQESDARHLAATPSPSSSAGPRMSAGTGDGQTPTESGAGEPGLRQRAEERVRRRRAELEEATQQTEAQAALRRAAEERAEQVTRELAEALAQLEAEGGELAQSRAQLRELEARDAATCAEVESLRDELQRERELGGEAGSAAEEEWRRRQEAEMACAAVRRELVHTKREAEELRRLLERMQAARRDSLGEWGLLLPASSGGGDRCSPLPRPRERALAAARSSIADLRDLEEELEEAREAAAAAAEKEASAREESARLQLELSLLKVEPALPTHGAEMTEERGSEEDDAVDENVAGQGGQRDRVDEERARLLSQIDELQAQQAELIAGREEKGRRVAEVEAEVALLRLRVSQADEMGRQVEAAANQMTALHDELAQERSGIENLRAELGGARQRLAECDGLMAAQSEEQQRLVDQLEARLHDALLLASQRAQEVEACREQMQRTEAHMAESIAALEIKIEVGQQQEEAQGEARQAAEAQLRCALEELTLKQMELEQARSQQQQQQEATGSRREAVALNEDEVHQRLGALLAAKEGKVRSLQAALAEKELRLQRQQQQQQQEEQQRCMASEAASEGEIEQVVWLQSAMEKQKKRIQELEKEVHARNKEVHSLRSLLVEAESMSHDVVRNLLGVKLDSTSPSSAAAARSGGEGNRGSMKEAVAAAVARRDASTRTQEAELSSLRAQLHDLIHEREGWLEEMSRKQAELVAARLAAEKSRGRDHALSADVAALKREKEGLRGRLAAVEAELRQVSGQQNLSQRIHHHAKIKEENNSLRTHNDVLAARLKATEALLARVQDELARMRSAAGKKPMMIDMDEEQRLRLKLQEVEEANVHMAHSLLSLCRSLVQAAGEAPDGEVGLQDGEQALGRLQAQLMAAQDELASSQLQMRIAGERRRLSELKNAHSPLGVSTANLSSPCLSNSSVSHSNYH